MVNLFEGRGHLRGQMYLRSERAKTKGYIYVDNAQNIQRFEEWLKAQKLPAKFKALEGAARNELRLMRTKFWAMMMIAQFHGIIEMWYESTDNAVIVEARNGR